MFRRKLPVDLAEETKTHLEAGQLGEKGRSEDDARRKSRQKFGKERADEERFRLYGRWVGLDSVLRDLRHGLRSLAQSPGFTIAAILTLALGMGANTAVFSAMNAVLMQSLPVSGADQLLYLRNSDLPRGTGTVGSHETFSYAVYDALRKQSGPMSAVMAYVPVSANKVAVRYGAEPEEAEGDMVSGTFFSGLGVKLPRGRGFTEQDEADHAPIAVISYNYWTRRFARSPNVLGTTLYVNGIGLTIVGVAGQGFEGLEEGRSTDFWIPLQSRPELNAWGNPPIEGKTYIADPTFWCLELIGRLSPGVTKAQAVAKLQPIFQSAAYIGVGSPVAGDKIPTLSVVDAKGFPSYAEMYGKPLRLLMGMVGLVLLIALTNVVMLLMARNSSRQREFSMKLALGAARADLMRQLLTESLLLACGGGLLAWTFAVYATRALGAWAQMDSSLAPDRTVLLFTLGMLVLAALLFGVAPLRIAISSGPALNRRTSAATSNSEAGKSRTGRILVALQMTLCLVLLVGAGLLIRSLRNLENTSLGFKVEGLAVFGVHPKIESMTQGRTFYRDLIGKLRNLPGVESVSVMAARIGSGASNNTVMMVDGRPSEVNTAAARTVRWNVVGPDFFHTLEVPVLAGRDFADTDTAATPMVGIINEEFARRFLPNLDPLGHTFGLNNGQFTFTIVGVVKNHKYRSIDEEPVPMAWCEYAQIPVLGGMDVEMRVHGEPLAILPTVRKAVEQLDPNLPLIQPMTQRAQYDLTIANQMLFARLAGFFGLLAAALVATGLYGALSYRVSMRTAEIGVRMAMGAQRGQVVWMILKDSLFVTATGVVIGIPLSIALGRLLASTLYGVMPLDLATYLLAFIGLAGIALGASAVPAVRAANVEPLIALRTE